MMECLESPKSQVASSLSGILRLLILLTFIGAYGFVALKFFMEGPTLFVFVVGSVSGMIVLPIAFYKGVLVPLVRGVQCPTCREWGLVRVALISFGYRFYRCDSCGQRCKRHDYESPWIDASGIADDDMYKPVPFFGPARKREASIAGLKVLGAISALFLLPGCGWLVGGEMGTRIGAALGWATVFIGVSSTSWTYGKKILPVQPVLWDRTIDE
jgi:hypothetical protein